MSSVTLLICIAVVAWLGQILLGWWQIRRFNQALNRLICQGRVGIGRSTGCFRSRVIMALSFDEDGHVCDGFMLRGLTVFARPVRLTQVIGLHKNSLEPKVIFPHQHACQTALNLAIQPQL
ncbi:transcriptional regulator GutM [Serratia symbiotica]|uniref:Transcriptional regulator GutM n=1 Tax=Serratia symbiotica TaxID=138074 RepID=A0A7D5SQX1_9GAMM|nr:transcriptional regulator GutM [Serratia symbiotica]QLH62215.1 transcriptional regulator GutM [Serratia symbiotica]